MEKEKEKYYRTDLLWIPCMILLVIMVCYFLFFIVEEEVVEDEPEFTIFGEECSLDQELYEMFHANDILTITTEENISRYDIKVELESDKELEEFTGLKFEPRVRLSFTTCKQVIVDEKTLINKYEESGWLFDETWKLTVKFLEDNCEKDYSGYGWECSYYFKIEEGCNDWKFMKYQCLEYLIEVNK